MTIAEIIQKLKDIRRTARDLEQKLSRLEWYEGETFRDGTYNGELAVDAIACQIENLVDELSSFLADIPTEPIPPSPGQLSLFGDE